MKRLPYITTKFLVNGKDFRRVTWLHCDLQLLESIGNCNSLYCLLRWSSTVIPLSSIIIQSPLIKTRNRMDLLSNCIHHPMLRTTIHSPSPGPHHIRQIHHVRIRNRINVNSNSVAWDSESVIHTPSCYKQCHAPKLLCKPTPLTDFLGQLGR